MLASTHLAFPVTRRRCGATSVDGGCRGPRGGLGPDRLAGGERQPAGRSRDPCESRIGDGTPRLPAAPRRPGAANRPHADDRARRLDPRDGRQFAHAAGGGGCRGRPRLCGRDRDPRRRIRSRRRLRAPARSGRGRRDRPQRGDRVGSGCRDPRRPRAGGRRRSARRAVRGGRHRPRRRSARCGRASAGPRTSRRSTTSRGPSARSPPRSANAGGARRWQTPGSRRPTLREGIGVRHPVTRPAWCSRRIRA